MIAYLKPKSAVSVEDIDTFRDKLATRCQETLGVVKTEVIVTAKAPYETA